MKLKLFPKMVVAHILRAFFSFLNLKKSLGYLSETHLIF